MFCPISLIKSYGFVHTHKPQSWENVNVSNSWPTLGFSFSSTLLGEKVHCSNPSLKKIHSTLWKPCEYADRLLTPEFGEAGLRARGQAASHLLNCMFGLTKNQLIRTTGYLVNSFTSIYKTDSWDQMKSAEPSALFSLARYPWCSFIKDNFGQTSGYLGGNSYPSKPHDAQIASIWKKWLFVKTRVKSGMLESYWFPGHLP